MKVLKGILLVIVVLIVIALLAALFVRKEYSVEREVLISRPRQEVFDYVKYLKNQDAYSKWNQLEPDMKKTYRGTDGTVGFVYAWEGDGEAGKGEQEIKNIVDGERIDCEVRFEKPMESTAPIYMLTEEVGANQTKVKWGFKGVMPYPMNLMIPIMGIEDLIGDDLQIGLNNLKLLLEKQR